MGKVFEPRRASKGRNNLIMADAKKYTMDELLAENEDSFKKAIAGDTVKGTVLSVKKHEILIDLGAQGVGLVPRREASFARNLNVGDEVTASVIEAEMKDGYVLLSLRKAVKDKGWDEIQSKLDTSETVDVTPFDANRGGLLVEYEGIRGFLPVSQLSAEHYPRVGSSDKDEILQRLNSLVGKTIKAAKRLLHFGSCLYSVRKQLFDSCTHANDRKTF